MIETTLDDQAAVEYAARFADFGEAVREQCRELGLRYLRARSDEDALDLLLAHASDVAVTSPELRAREHARGSRRPGRPPSASTSSGTRHARLSPVSAAVSPGASSDPPVCSAS